MTEVVIAVTDFCFNNFPLRRISAEVFANNPASARVLEKAGFTFEGDKVAPCKPLTCVSIDHGRYGSPSANP